ncbi:MAG: hypothetical protein J6O71_00110, partial [Lachnospiraceae bacterium]|nr:hypothetical protein [Lachnospiraceae bacterium]
MKVKGFIKRKTLKLGLSFLTAVALLSGDMGASFVYALPAEEVSENAVVQEETEPVTTVQEARGDELEISSEVSENSASDNKAEESEEKKEEQELSEDSVSGNDTMEEQENTEADEVSENEAKSVSGNTVGELSDAQIETAEVLKEELKSIEHMEEGKDYVADQAFFFTDSRAEAKSVAESYGAELVGFNSGVATVKFEHRDTIDKVISNVVDTVDAVKEATEIINDKGDESASVETVAEVD